MQEVTVKPPITPLLLPISDDIAQKSGNRRGAYWRFYGILVLNSRERWFVFRSDEQLIRYEDGHSDFGGRYSTFGAPSAMTRAFLI